MLSNLPALLPTTQERGSLKPTCPNTYDNPGNIQPKTYLPIHSYQPEKMRPNTYLHIHSYQQTQKDAFSNLPVHTLLLTTLERYGLNPTCPYTLTITLVSYLSNPYIITDAAYPT